MQLQFYQSDAEFFPVDTGPFMVLSARDERAFQAHGFLFVKTLEKHTKPIFFSFMFRIIKSVSISAFV